jgi:hypothetical protein
MITWQEVEEDIIFSKFNSVPTSLSIINELEQSFNYDNDYYIGKLKSSMATREYHGCDIDGGGIALFDKYILFLTDKYEKFILETYGIIPIHMRYIVHRYILYKTGLLITIE